MVRFVGIKINYDDRDLPWASKYAVVPGSDDLQRFVQRYRDEGVGGFGFHECLNFQIREDVLVQAYLPPTSIPGDVDEDYTIFSFTYQSDPTVPSVVLGVHGAANRISKTRTGAIRRVIGAEALTYHVEADPDFVTLFSGPLPYDPQSDRYAPLDWRMGLRYLTATQAANILSDALAKGQRDHLESVSNSYRAFVERGIEVIKRIRTAYELSQESGAGARKGGGSFADKVLDEKGEELVYRRERKNVVKQGLRREMVIWASQTNPTLPYDIETVRHTPEGGVRPHFIEVKSTTLDDS
jgi:Domain of unknown function (DUF3883)